MGFANPFKTKTQKKQLRKEKRLANTELAIGRARLQREKDVFMEEGQRRRLALNEELAARGMAGGTFAKYQSEALERAFERGMTDIGERGTLLEQGTDLAKYKRTAAKRARPLEIINGIVGMGQTGLGIAGGLGAFSGDDDEGSELLDYASFG